MFVSTAGYPAKKVTRCNKKSMKFPAIATALDALSAATAAPAGDRIIYVGPADDVCIYINNDTEVIDLKGQFLLTAADYSI